MLYILIMILIIYFLHAQFSCTWSIYRFLVRSLASQTVLRAFIYIYFLWTVGTWCCEIEIDIYNQNIIANNRIFYRKNDLLPGVSLSLSGACLIPKLNCGVLSNLTFSGEYAPGAKKFLLNRTKPCYICRLCILYNLCIPGESAGFSTDPLPIKLYCGPLSKFIFSGLYVPGAI